MRKHTAGPVRRRAARRQKSRRMRQEQRPKMHLRKIRLTALGRRLDRRRGRGIRWLPPFAARALVVVADGHVDLCRQKVGQRNCDNVGLLDLLLLQLHKVIKIVALHTVLERGKRRGWGWKLSWPRKKGHWGWKASESGQLFPHRDLDFLKLTKLEVVKTIL